MKSTRTFLLISQLTFCLACSGIDEEPIDPDSIISLSILEHDGSIPIAEAIADGDTNIVLVAQISESADDQIKSISFKSSEGGSFIGLDNDNDVKLVDNLGMATTVFTLPLFKEDRLFFFRAEVTFESSTYFSEKSISLKGVENIISLDLSDQDGGELATPLFADGTTLITLNATINFNQDELNQVTFNKSGGTFESIDQENSVLPIDSEHSASIILRVPTTVGKLFLSAQAASTNDYLAKAELNLLRALPDSIITETSSSSISLGTSVNLSAFALRNHGKVSDGTPIKFDAVQLDGDEKRIPVGRFTGLSQANTDGNGKVSGIVFISDTNDIDTTKPVLLIASSLNNQNELVESVIQINVNE